MKNTGLKEKLTKLAELKFPYETIETSGDKFTLELRNSIVNMLRDAYILGACDILNAYAEEESNK